jgi:hypothetical protein
MLIMILTIRYGAFISHNHCSLYTKAVTSQSNTMEPMIPLFNLSIDFTGYTVVMGLILSYSFTS